MAMLHIIHTRGRRAPAIERFDRTPVRLGSAPDSDVAFAASDAPGVMPRHAEIRIEGGALLVVDLGTPSGTFVNGARVHRHALRGGDAVAPGSPGARADGRARR